MVRRVKADGVIRTAVMSPQPGVGVTAMWEKTKPSASGKRATAPAFIAAASGLKS